MISSGLFRLFDLISYASIAGLEVENGVDGARMCVLRMSCRSVHQNSLREYLLCEGSHELSQKAMQKTQAQERLNQCRWKSTYIATMRETFAEVDIH